MQSFYISNKKQNANFEIFNKYLNIKEVKNKYLNINFFFSKNNDSIVDNNGRIYINLGVLIYKDKFNKEGLKKIIQDIKEGQNIEDILKSEGLRGQFLLIIIDENSIYLATDKLGYYGSYIYQKNGTIAFSNSIISLAKNNITTLNYIGISQYLSENYKYLTYACCDQNIFNEISYLEPGTIYKIKKNEFSKNNYYNIKNHLKIGNYKNINEIAEKATSILKDSLKFIKNTNLKVNSDLTGGIDTRVVVSVLKNLDIDFSTGTQLINQYSDFSNYGKYSEKQIINKIEEVLGLNNHVTDEIDYNDNKNMIDEITFLLSNKQTYNRRTSYFFNLMKNGINLNISGLSGTELLRLSYYKHFRNNNNLDLDQLLKEYVEQVDIMKDEYISKDAYYSHLNNFYNENLKNISYKNAKDLSSYIDYFAFYRTHFTRYHGLANSMIPFYTPYGDFEFAKLMYEVEYNSKSRFLIQRKILEKTNLNLAKINCTRGFPLNSVSISNFWKFKNIINEDIPQQHFTIIQKLKDYFSYNFIRFCMNNENIYNYLFKKFISTNPSNKKNIWGNPNDFSIISYYKKFTSSDLDVFSIIDRKKLEYYIKKDCNYNVLNRVNNLNRILSYCK